MMMKLLLVFVLLAFTHGYCPPEFDLVNEECRGNYTRVHSTKRGSVEAAIGKCKEVVGYPIVIHSDDDNTYWKNHAASTSDQHNVVIGLTCNTDTYTWEWADGTALDYKPTAYPDYLNSGCAEGYSWVLVADGAWTYITSEAQWTFDVFCITQSSRVPFPFNDGCDNFDEDEDDGVCYMVVETKEDWKDAEMNCRLHGANLASIHNSKENSFVRRLAVANGSVNGLFLGATMIGKDKKFEWVDGSEWDYAYFYPGFPMANIGDCLAMDTSTSTGQWMNTDCASKLPVACVRNEISLADPTCSTGPWKESTIITTPGFPYSALTPCDFFFTVDEAMKVELEIVYLEANECCDSLILYDGFLGGNVIAKLTGEVRNTTYTSTSNLMRVSWQPSGRNNVFGLAMKYHGIWKR